MNKTFYPKAELLMDYLRSNYPNITFRKFLYNEDTNIQQAAKRCLEYLELTYLDYKFIVADDLTPFAIKILIIQEFRNCSRIHREVLFDYEDDVCKVFDELISYITPVKNTYEIEIHEPKIKPHICSQCGATIPSGTHICEYCGAEYYSHGGGEEWYE
jgi:hypothetical protein